MLIPATIFSIKKKKILGLLFPFKIVLWLVMLLLLEQNFLYSFEEIFCFTGNKWEVLARTCILWAKAPFKEEWGTTEKQ